MTTTVSRTPKYPIYRPVTPSHSKAATPVIIRSTPAITPSHTKSGPNYPIIRKK
jgi:hypothetical protein